MDQRENVSTGSFAGLVLVVVITVVAIPVMIGARRGPTDPGSDVLPAEVSGGGTPPSGTPPAATVEPLEPEEPPPPPEPEAIMGKLGYDPANGWFELETTEGKRVIPTANVIGVEARKGAKEEFVIFSDGTKVSVPPGFVPGLPREVRYRFDYGRSGNVDPDAPPPDAPPADSD